MQMRNLKLALGSLVLLLAFIGQVDAARLGSGKNVGRTPTAPMQRQATPAPAAKPAQVAPAPTPAAAPAAAPSRFGGFGGILGGLAAGIGLGYLFSHLGMGEMGSGIASLITGILIAFLRVPKLGSLFPSNSNFVRTSKMIKSFVEFKNDFNSEGAIELCEIVRLSISFILSILHF